MQRQESSLFAPCCFQQQKAVRHEASAAVGLAAAAAAAAAVAPHGVGDFAEFPTEVMDLILSCLDDSCRRAMHMVCNRLRWALLRQMLHEIGYLGALLKAVQQLLSPATGQQPAGYLHPLLPHPIQQVAEAEAAGPANQAAAQPAHVAAEVGVGEVAAQAAGAPDAWGDVVILQPIALMHDSGVPEELSGKLELNADIREGGRICSMQRVLDSATQEQYVEQKLLQSMLQEQRLKEQQAIKQRQQKTRQEHKLQRQQQQREEKQQLAAGAREVGDSSNSIKPAAATAAATPVCVTSPVCTAVETKRTQQPSGSSTFKNAQFEYRHGGRYLTYGLHSSQGWEDQVCVNLRLHLTLLQTQAEWAQARMLQGGIMDYIERLMPCRTEVNLHLACRAARHSTERSYLTQNLQGRQHPQLVPQTQMRGMIWPAEAVITTEV